MLYPLSYGALMRRRADANTLIAKEGRTVKGSPERTRGCRRPGGATRRSSRSGQNGRGTSGHIATRRDAVCGRVHRGIAAEPAERASPNTPGGPKLMAGGNQLAKRSAETVVAR